MRLTRLSTAATIIALAILILFVLSVPHAREVPQAPKQNVPTEVPAVTVHDSYKKGTHTITGTLMAPDACTSVTASVSAQGDAADPKGIALALVMPMNSGVCLEVPTRTIFSAAISAPPSLPITVTVNGIVASTTAL